MSNLKEFQWWNIHKGFDENDIDSYVCEFYQIENELGDAIFSLVNLARFLDISAENALRKTNEKFKNRFRYIEKVLEKNGKKFEETKLKELDKYWNEAKGKE